MDPLPDPEIDYPTRWSYRVVGPNESALRVAVQEIVAHREHVVTLSRMSRTGRYVSLNVEVLVHDHEERRGLANELHAHPAVVFVL